MASTTGVNTPGTSVAGLPPAKLPLAARKNLRDKWESEKPELEKKASEILGVPWTFPVDYTYIWPHAERDLTAFPAVNPGGLVKEYLSDFVSNLKRYVDKHGAEGIEELNNVASTHTVVIGVTENPKINYCGTEITPDGVLRIVFKEGNLGVNVSDATQDIAGAVNAAGKAKAAAGGGSVLDFAAKSNISREWDAKVSDLQNEFQDMLGLPLITLSPEFENNAAKLAAYEAQYNKTHRYASQRDSDALRDDWLSRIGEFTYQYFESALKLMQDKGFGTDDMVQEGFKEAVEKNEISLQVIDGTLPTGKGKGSSYNEASIDNGVLVLRTTPRNWTVNLSDATVYLIDLL